MLSHNSLMFLINHVFLPPKLPQKNDSQQGFGFVFTDVMIDALRDLLTFSGERRNEIGVLIDMLCNAKIVLDDANDEIVEVELRQALRKIVEKGILLGRMTLKSLPLIACPRRLPSTLCAGSECRSPCQSYR